MNQFPLDVKSTLDKTMYGLKTTLEGDYPGLQALDIDNVEEFEVEMGSTAPAVLWQFSMLDPSPFDPLYKGSFLVGVKTTRDSGNYQLTALTAELFKVFQVGEQFPVGDYSGVSEVLNKGVLTVTSIVLAPQQFDNQHSIRTCTVAFAAQRFP
ncbi:MAG: hypothetical protein DRP70_17330 [Spirochaetes bacterium]|nr:MAG: hypothetical protein DRP70_17330 [Spirochaetota bacterium]